MSDLYGLLASEGIYSVANYVLRGVGVIFIGGISGVASTVH